ncbi:TIR domain-containing protein [Pseudonocardia xinjiangensis]|uniref:toll/interleukin-1 receptor domain-containing protein n=1 Tax=Pseudonocardia xinjiangensis TaxID=75289 RepID=UPI003D93FAC4
MIELGLSPRAISAQTETELTLEVRNVGGGTCKQVKVRLGRPHGLLFVGGSPYIEVELLAPGQRVARCFTVRAGTAGRIEIGTANYSYRDPQGRSRHPNGSTWILEVGPPVAVPLPERRGPSVVARKKVFISYRWSDSKDRAYLLYRELVRAFGAEHVHLDQEGAVLGGDFQTRLDNGLQASSAMLVLIGPEWNPEVRETGRRRLDDENDAIRREVDAAIRAGMYLIPVMSWDLPVPAETDLPECIRPLLRKEVARIHSTMVMDCIKRIVDDLRPHVAGGRFR